MLKNFEERDKSRYPPWLRPCLYCCKWKCAKRVKLCVVVGRCGEKREEILYCRRGCHSRMIRAISLITTSLHSIWVPETDYLIFLSFPVQSLTALSKSSLTHFVFKSRSTPLSTPLGGRISITRDKGRIYLNGPPHSKETPKLLFWVDSLLYNRGTSPGRIRLNKVLNHFNTNVRLVLSQGYYCFLSCLRFPRSFT